MIGRIRTVKPELFSHYLLWHLGELTNMPKLAYWYIGLWCMTDREARLEWKPMELKAALAPFDNIDFALVLNVLANAGFIVRYRVGHRLYGWLPRFLTHQNINGRESGSRLPPPPSCAEAWHEDRMLRADFEALALADLLREPDTVEDGVSCEPTRPSRVVDASATRDGRDTYRTEQNGTEQNGTEQERTPSSDGTARPSRGRKVSPRDNGASPAVASSDTETRAEDAPASSGGEDTGKAVARVLTAPVQLADDGSRNVASLPAVVGKANAAAIAGRISKVLTELHEGTRTRLKREQMEKLQADVIFLYWQAVFDHPNAILDDKRRARIVARLRENGGNMDELCYALDGASKDDHIMATGKSAGGTKYDGIETVLRDRGQVERFAARRKGFLAGKPHAGLAKLEAALRGETQDSSSQGGGHAG